LLESPSKKVTFPFFAEKSITALYPKILFLISSGKFLITTLSIRIEFSTLTFSIKEFAPMEQKGPTIEFFTVAPSLIAQGP
jgi:hypothetical protein